MSKSVRVVQMGLSGQVFWSRCCVQNMVDKSSLSGNGYDHVKKYTNLLLWVFEGLQCSIKTISADHHYEQVYLRVCVPDRG